MKLSGSKWETKPASGFPPEVMDGWNTSFVSFWGFGRPIFRGELLLPEGQEPVAVPHMRQPVVGCTQIFRGCDETGKKTSQNEKDNHLTKAPFFFWGGF